CWMGWERKRGKLEQLNQLLVDQGPKTEDEGDESASAPSPLAHPRQPGPSPLVHVGDPAQLQGVRFVITLDSDTQLPHGTACRLAETLAHRLNRPRLGPDGRTVA